MLPSFSDITYFIEIAGTKNISRAAERLGITQPTLSSAMKRLEESLGVDLLLRSKNGVQLTKAGHDFLAKSNLLLANWEQIKIDLSRSEQELSGDYVIGCHPSVALNHLHKFLPKLIHDFPGLAIKLRHDLSRLVTEEVISSRIDFGLVVNPVKHPDLVIVELCCDKVGFWTKPDLVTTLTPSLEAGVLIADLNLLQTRRLLTDLQKLQISHSRLIHSDHLEVIADLSRAGVGVGILPERVARRYQLQQLLQVGNIELPSFDDKVCLVYRADSHRSKASQLLISFIRDEVW